MGPDATGWAIGVGALVLASGASAQSAPPSVNGEAPAHPMGTEVPVRLESAGPPARLELFPMRGRPGLDSPLLRCDGDCTASVPRGRHTLAVGATPTSHAGTRPVEVTRPLRLRVEPAATTRTSALLVMLAGFPLAGSGAALLAASSRRDRPALFWGGFTMTATGVALVPVGIALLSGKPHVHALHSEGTSAATAGEAAPSYHPPPDGPRELPTAPGQEAPPGYRVERRRATGLVLVGAIPFTAGYTLAAAAGTYALAARRSNGDAALLAPVVGPLLTGSSDPGYVV